MTTAAPPLHRTYALVETRIGRPLRPSEKAIDVLRLDAALETAKNELEQAIRSQMLTATRAWWTRTHGQFGTPQIRMTQAMRKPLLELHRLGLHEAALELHRLGYTGISKPDGRRRPRRYGAPDPNPGFGREEAFATVKRGLPGIGVRIAEGLVEADLTSPGAAVLAHALLQIPGARDIASRVVSTALYSGMGQTFEENKDLVTGWEWTAVMDGGTCDPCAEGDGTTYTSLDDALADLPGFGPYPDCDGGGRCRCRLVPTPA